MTREVEKEGERLETACGNIARCKEVDPLLVDKEDIGHGGGGYGAGHGIMTRVAILTTLTHITCLTKHLHRP